MAGRRSALLVGIDAYDSAGVLPLTSCVADARELANVLKRHDDGRPNFDVAELLGEEARNPVVTRLALRQQLADALDQARDHDFVFYFSGHGEDDPRFGAAIVTQEGERVSMDEILTLLIRAEFAQATVILDTCYAGNLGHLTAVPGLTFLRKNIAIIAASREDQSAASGAQLSPFTEVLIDGLKGGAADLRGHVTAASLYDYTAQSFSATQQSPVFHASLNAANEPLREVDLPVTRKTMNRIHKIFKDGSERYELEKADVPAKGTKTERQKNFQALEELQRAGLVSGDGEGDLRKVARASGAVILTPRGRHAVRLAEKDLV